ncbi:MAG: PH domain-containing protein [Cryobacterium sp.]|nr:PH domain-containing protein [Cryobacterium sp.]
MTQHEPQPEQHAEPVPASNGPLVTPATDLTDGEWHHLHPATPLLRGGIALIAILGVIVVNLRDRLIGVFFPQWSSWDYEGDAIDLVVEGGFVPIALGVVAVVLVLFIAGFWISWRMHTFRVTDEVVEVRSGIVFRTHRKAPLDRIQGIDIQRPFIARLFGAAKLQVSQAGSDANVELSYLRSAQADDLRRDILLLASGSARQGASLIAREGGLIEQRVAELLAPELDPDAAPPESVVHIGAGRLAGSLALSETTIIAVIFLVGGIVFSVFAESLGPLLGVLFPVIGIGGYQVSQFIKSLRYSIASTPDGIRVGFGVLSTSNSTLPPGRIHSVQVTQSLLWRPAGWWMVRVNRAAQASASTSQQTQSTTILPVGDLADVGRVLELILPDVGDRAAILEGLVSKGDDEGWTNSPPRARAVRWFSRRRNGFRMLPGGIVLRHGQIWRDIVVVPEPRVQSVALHRGPLGRAMRLSRVYVHTVAGPISPAIGAIDPDDARQLFEDVARATVEAGLRDRTHRWRSA